MTVSTIWKKKLMTKEMFMSELAIQTGANAQSVVSWILSETSLCLKDLRKNFQENFGGEVFFLLLNILYFEK